MERAQGSPLTVEEAKARLLAPDPPVYSARAPRAWRLPDSPGLALIGGAVVAGLLVGRLRGLGKLITIGMLVARSPIGRAAALALARSASRRYSRRSAMTAPIVVREGAERWW